MPPQTWNRDSIFWNRWVSPASIPSPPGTYPTFPYRTGERGSGGIAQAKGLVRAGRYSGYGAPEDTRDYYLHMKKLGSRSGPNIAFDLPTQCGYDSDSPVASGEVGRVGVAVDTLRDMEVIFEAFSGENDIDRTASNFTINAPANILMAMYMALADKRGISWDKLRATPQNDILKEFVARGTYIFPPRPSMRMFRDSLVFFSKNLPNVNITSIGGYHIREAGATREQDLAFSMANRRSLSAGRGECRPSRGFFSPPASVSMPLGGAWNFSRRSPFTGQPGGCGPSF